MATKSKHVATESTSIESNIETPDVDEAGNTSTGYDSNGFILYGFDRTKKAAFIGTKYVTVDEMIPECLLYNVGYGYTQAVADSKAGIESAIMGTSKNVKARWDYKKCQETAKRFGLAMPNGVTESIKRQLVVLVTNEALTDKAEAIFAGEVSTRERGPRLVGFDKIFYDKAYAWLKNYRATRKLGEMPKGEELAKQIAFVQSNPKVGPTLRAKAQEEHDFMNQELEEDVLGLLNEAA
jgi:hypothetical protein